MERNFEDPEPWINKADPDHPSLIDTKHQIAELYNVENVPTGFWIDEDRRFVRPGDIVFGSDYSRFLTGINAKEHKSALKEWVRTDKKSNDYDLDQITERQTNNSTNREDARAYFHLAQWLYENEHDSYAEKYFNKAIELAPDDVAIRRGSMRMRDKNPLGLGFIIIAIKRYLRGLTYYNPLPEFS